MAYAICVKQAKVAEGPLQVFMNKNGVLDETASL